MKIDERARPLPAALSVDPNREFDERTRDRVCRMILEQGPVTAADLASALGLSQAAVRRHLDVLLADGLVTVRESPTGRQRGRGRPARRFVVTDHGHAAMTNGYAELAASALQFLKDVAGPDVVRRFADHRVADLEARHRAAVEAAGDDPVHRSQALARGLSRDGYAASTRIVQGGATALGVQLCQGHCPVQDVAREFPELCEAETDAFSRLLGVHVQRLATLAHGEHVCTTHVPASSTLATRSQPSSSTERQSE